MNPATQTRATGIELGAQTGLRPGLFYQETNVNEWLWKVLAKVISKPRVMEYLVRRSYKTPYFPIGDYMDRWWLFNRYSEIGKYDRVDRRFKWLPSVRIHHIKLPDDARHLHDHPWNARTIILRGWYRERRLINGEERNIYRQAGDTAALMFGEYHAIDEVSPRGVWTLFITWKYKGMWGFLVDGKKVPWREYTNEPAVPGQ